MKNLRQFFKRVRLLISLVATLIFFLLMVLPPVLGLMVRQAVLKGVDDLQDTLSDVSIDALHVESVRAGWFSSDINLVASGQLLSADGVNSDTRTGVLHINHGPVIWHLSDSLLALADFQLQPQQDTDTAQQHFSGSAILHLQPALRGIPRLDIRLKAIAGIQAGGGEHWLELQTTSALLPWQGSPHQQLWLDLDVAALNAAGMAPDMARWQQDHQARLSNNRLLFYIRPQ